MTVLMVCGFGRCGSSLLMQMLHAGGIPVHGEYPAFEDYRVMPGQVDVDWLAVQDGHAVKVLDPHKVPGIRRVPRIAIWIDRDPAEQAKSHAKFFGATMGISMSRGDRRAFEASFRRERKQAMESASPDQDKLFRTTFEMLVESPGAVLTVLAPWLERFGFKIDAVKAQSAVRSRGRRCLPYLLEAELVSENEERSLS